MDQWWRTYARQTIDAGASLYVSHGSTVLNGVEVYRGGVILYGLGNFIFQTRKGRDGYGPDSWRSVIAEGLYENFYMCMRRFVCVVHPCICVYECISVSCVSLQDPSRIT